MKQIEKGHSATSLIEKAPILELVAVGFMTIPNLTTNAQPIGTGIAIKIDAENVTKFMMGTVKVFGLKAQMDLHDSRRAGQKGSMTHQLQDRQLQAN